MSEQITNLPWLLEIVARRLEDVASRLRAEEAAGRSTPLTSKSVKEALLQAVSLSGNGGDSQADDLLRQLSKELNRTEE